MITRNIFSDWASPEQALAGTAAHRAIDPATLEAISDVANGVARLDANGDLVGPIVPGEVESDEVVTDGRLAVRGGVLVLGDGVTEGGILLPYLQGSDSFVIVQRGATATDSAQNLRDAYAAACALTPGGNALSAQNRAAVLVTPGLYDFGTGDGSNHGLELDTEFVDLLGVGGSPFDVRLTSQIATASRGTVEQTADDVRISNLWIGIETGGDTVPQGDTRPSAYFPVSDLTLTQLRNVVINPETTANKNAMRTAIEYSGLYIGVITGAGAFGAASGSAFSGICIDCIAGTSSWGGAGGSADGTLIRCAMGTFVSGQLVLGGNGWGAAFSGVMEHCRFVMTGTNNTAAIVVSGAVLRNSILVGTGSGLSVNADSSAAIEITNCHTPQGIGSNVTNTNTADASRVSWNMFVGDAETDLETGDGQAWCVIPAKLNGKRLRHVRADVLVAGDETSGTTDIQIRNATDSVDLLSTKLTIEDDETSSATATTPAVINHSNSLLQTGDLIYLDIPDVTSTAPKGLVVTLEAY